MSDASPNPTLVYLVPSALRGATEGPVPFVPRAFGAIRGVLVERVGKEGGTWEVDAVKYTLRDERSKAGRVNFPLVRLMKPTVICFRPQDGNPGQPPLLRLVGQRKALEDAGLVEIVGTIAGHADDHTTFAITGPTDVVTVKGQAAGDVGAMVQAFARLTAGVLVLESSRLLAFVDADAEPPADVVAANLAASHRRVTEVVMADPAAADAEVPTTETPAEEALRADALVADAPPAEIPPAEAEAPSA